MPAKKVDRAVRLAEEFGGATLRWDGRPVGDNLQGWYPSKTKARRAHAEMLPLADGTKIQLILPPAPEPPKDPL